MRARHQHFEHERLACVAAPGLERFEPGPLSCLDVFGVVGTMACEHFDERAGERRGKRIGRPGERDRTGFFGRRADGEAGLEQVGDHR